MLFPIVKINEKSWEVAVKGGGPNVNLPFNSLSIKL
jgi:hypothetical protein